MLPRSSGGRWFRFEHFVCKYQGHDFVLSTNWGGILDATGDLLKRTFVDSESCASHISLLPPSGISATTHRLLLAGPTSGTGWGAAMTDITDELQQESWVKLLTSPQRSESYINGHVEGKQSFDAFLEAFSKATHSSFTTRRSSKIAKDQEENILSSVLRKQVLWQKLSGDIKVPFDGTPFIVCGGTVVLECQHGRLRHKKPKVYGHRYPSLLYFVIN